MLWLIICVLVLICFAAVLLFGAPYVPTLKKQQQDALKLLQLKPGQTLLELGSGDGRMLRAAAEQGIYAVGYELNPILVLVSYFVCFKYRTLISIRWGSFWGSNWPSTDGIYVFLHTRFMMRLDNKIIQEYSGKNVKVVSYAFKIPNKNIAKTKEALYLYEYKLNKK